MFRTSPDGIYLLTDVGDVLCASGPCACLLGDQREEVKGRSALDFIRSDAHEPSRDALRMALAARGACARIQVRGRRKERSCDIESTIPNFLETECLLAVIGDLLARGC